MGAARWLQDLTLLRESEIRDLHAQVVTLLRNGQEYGAYDAVKMVAGDDAACILARNGFLKSR